LMLMALTTSIRNLLEKVSDKVLTS